MPRFPGASDSAHTTVSGTPRSAASAPPNASAPSATADPSAPTTMCPGWYAPTGRQCPRTTTTGTVANADTCRLTDPSISPDRPPRPREPTTTMSAAALCSHSIRAADPSASSFRTSGPKAARIPLARIRSALSRATSSVPPASGGPADPGAQVWHRVRVTPRSRASRAAQLSAWWLLDEPSYPTRIPCPVLAMAASHVLPAHGRPAERSVGRDGGPSSTGRSARRGRSGPLAHGCGGTGPWCAGAGHGNVDRGPQNVAGKEAG